MLCRQTMVHKYKKKSKKGKNRLKSFDKQLLHFASQSPPSCSLISLIKRSKNTKKHRKGRFWKGFEFLC